MGLVQSVEGLDKERADLPGTERKLLLPDRLELEPFHAFGLELRQWPFLGLEPAGWLSNRSRPIGSPGSQAFGLETGTRRGRPWVSESLTADAGTVPLPTPPQTWTDDG